MLRSRHCPRDRESRKQSRSGLWVKECCFPFKGAGQQLLMTCFSWGTSLGHEISHTSWFGIFLPWSGVPDTDTWLHLYSQQTKGTSPWRVSLLKCIRCNYWTISFSCSRFIYTEWPSEALWLYGCFTFPLPSSTTYSFSFCSQNLIWPLGSQQILDSKWQSVGVHKWVWVKEWGMCKWGCESVWLKCVCVTERACQP